MERCEYEARSVEPVFPSIADALRLAAAEIERLRADNSDLRIDNRRLADLHAGIYHAHAAERALADQLARALRVVRVTRHPTHVDNVWSVVSHAIAAYEEARRER